MANAADNKKFADALLPQYLLDEAISWIESNLEPEEVFSKSQLEEWAENNDYVKADGDV